MLIVRNLLKISVNRVNTSINWRNYRKKKRGRKNMKQRRTDLAEEAKELWQESGGELGELSGIKVEELEKSQIHISRVEILDQRGEKSLGKPIGLYTTLTLEEEFYGEYFEQWGETLSEELSKMMGTLYPSASVLVVGLGNEAITADAIGPQVQSLLAVTRHLVEQMPEHFSNLRPVTAIATGVLGTTGLESSEMVGALCKEIRPDCVIAVDALASRSLHRVCRSIQLANSGITPGSGVGNHRGTLNQKTLGIPVIAVGVPTVVDGDTLVADLLGLEEGTEFSTQGADFFVTPKEIDTQVVKLSKLIAKGINRALNPSLNQDDIELLLGLS